MTRAEREVSRVGTRQGRLLVLVWIAACGAPRPDAPNTATATGTRAELAADDRPLPLDPSVRRGRLANGLTYFVKANKRPDKRVQLWLVVDAGSVLETEDQRGYAHMVEHLAFEGTKRFPRHEIQDFVERSGMRFAADLNAGTDFDETTYMLAVPSDVVGKGLDVLRDWTAEITFDPQEVVEERSVIEEERRFRNSVGFRMRRQIAPVLYQGSPYAQREPIGTTEVINAATADRLKAFYASWYRPDLMAVIAVGDLEPAGIASEIEAKFSSIPAAAPTAPVRMRAAIETRHASRLVVARDPEVSQISVSLRFQFPHRPDASASDFRRGYADQMFARLLAERLDLLTRRAESVWTGAMVRFAATVRGVDELSLNAVAKEGRVNDVVRELASELARAQQHGFDDRELGQAAAAIVRMREEAAREADTRDSRDLAAELERHFLVSEAMVGPAAELALARRFVPAITNADLMAVARSAAGGGRVVVIGAPAAAAVPTEHEIANQLAAATRPMERWQGLDLSAPLLATEPRPGRVTAVSPLSHGVAVWTLSNGARVFIKPTGFKRDEVLITAVSNGGTSAVSATAYPHARFAADIVNASGFGSYGPEELQKKLANKKVRVATAIDHEQERVTAEASPEDLEPALQLVHAAFTAPRRDEAAFAAWHARAGQIAKRAEANAQLKFVVGAFEFLYSGHPRIPLPLPSVAAVDAVTLDGALAEYRARFANAADFDFVVVGAFDPTKLKILVERYLASLPATGARREAVADVGLRAKAGTVAHTIRAGAEAKASSLLVSRSPAAWSLALEADAVILSHVMDLELLAVLREQLGGTYAVGVQCEVDRAPPQAVSLSVSFESAPDRAAALQAAAWGALDRIATTVTDDLVAKVRQQIRRTAEHQRAENPYWRDALVRHARYGDDLDAVVDVERVIARATKERIRRAARVFASPTNRATLTMVPER